MAGVSAGVGVAVAVVVGHGGSLLVVVVVVVKRNIWNRSSIYPAFVCACWSDDARDASWRRDEHKSEASVAFRRQEEDVKMKPL